LGRVNELLIKQELCDLTEKQEEAEEDNGSLTDSVSTAANLESALNQVYNLLEYKQSNHPLH
jgi:methylthioribose-1-phosphate isomerase